MIRRRYLRNKNKINVPTPDCYYDFSQGSNDDETRKTIKDYSGNGKDAVAHNFAWSGMSGYGGYNCYFSSNSGVDRYEGSFTNDKAHITKIIDEVNKNLINIYIINNFNIKISGLTGNNLVRIGPPNVATLSLSNGTHKIDSSLFPKEYNYSIGILGDIGECDITIEFIPEYPGALVFDEEKEIPKNIVDLIEQNGIQFTKAGKPVDNPDKYSISIDVDTNKITVITK